MAGHSIYRSQPCLRGRLSQSEDRRTSATKASAFVGGKSEGIVVKALVLHIIRLYQRTWSQVVPPSCRFVPSCSEYACEAVEKYGLLKGGWLAARRLSRCHPFNPGGYDPVPD